MHPPLNSTTESCAVRVLITRLSHIGDCVFTMPMATAIKEQIENAWIGWAVESPSHQLLEGHPGVDEIIRVPKGWLKSPSKWKALRHQLRGYEFDVSLDPQGLTKSACLGWLSGAKQRIGLGASWSGELAPWTYTNKVIPEATHIVPRSLELLKPLGISVQDAETQLKISEPAMASMRNWTTQAHLGCGFAVINPGASWPSKMWEEDRFGIVAKRLGERVGITSVVVWAGEQEKELAHRIVQHSGGHALVAPKTSLMELAALCSLSQLFLSADTGPLHIASAVGTPCVGLYGPTRPDHCGAWGTHCRNLQAWYQAGSRKQRRKAKNDAMRDISVEVVTNACLELNETFTQNRRVA